MLTLSARLSGSRSVAVTPLVVSGARTVTLKERSTSWTAPRHTGGRGI